MKNLENIIKLKQLNKVKFGYIPKMEDEEESPCGEGYIQKGTKMVDGKEVANCVPKEEVEVEDEMPEEMEKEGPCWKGYEQIGTKMVDGKEVPNCVPIKKEEMETEFDFGSYPWDQCIADNEAKYGKKGAEAVCGAIKAKYGDK